MQNWEIGVCGMPPLTWVDWWQPCGLPPRAWLHRDPFIRGLQQLGLERESVDLR